jgi:hypothetical protein
MTIRPSLAKELTFSDKPCARGGINIVRKIKRREGGKIAIVINQ